MTPTAGSHPDEPVSARCVVIVVGGAPPRAVASDASVDIRVANSTLESVGMLAHVGDAWAGRSIVLVWGEAWGAVDCAEFVQALRRVDAGVRVGVVRRAGDSEGIGRRADFVVDSSADAGALLRAALAGTGEGGRGSGATAAEGVGVAAGREGPSAERVRLAAPGLAGERALVEAMLVQGDVLGAALDRLRSLFAGSRMDFVALAKGPSPAWRAGEHGARVSHRGQSFGELVGSASDARILEEAAGWLGCWLALRGQQAALRHAALTDGLTGAWNRRALEGFLSASLERCRHGRREVSVALLEIEDLGSLNRSRGRGWGDEVLRDMSRLLNGSVRRGDRVCRLGGGSFALILEDGREGRSSGRVSLAALCARLRRVASGGGFGRVGPEGGFPVGLSGGLATFPWEATDSAGLLAVAEREAERSARSGGPLVVLGV